MTKRNAWRRIARRFGADASGVSAIELAIIAPGFLLFLFGGFETALSAWYRSVLYESADRGARYMRDTRMNKEAFTASGLRSAICGFAAASSISCKQRDLKIALYVADDPIASPVVVPAVIDNVTPSLTARTYILVVGMEWPFNLPTSKLLLPSSGSRVQVAVRSFVTPDERSIEQ